MTIRTLSRYELLEEIGRGNMGVVYRARDPVMDRTVAIKVIRPEQIESLLQLSETELELRARTRGGSETVRFTFLRPALEEAALRDYRERILGR